MINKNRKWRWALIGLLGILGTVLGSIAYSPKAARARWVEDFVLEYPVVNNARSQLGPRCQKVLEKANTIAVSNITYDPAYSSIKYPGGDVPPDRGVCTDVITRSFRNVGFDFQKEVHESMKKNKHDYPNLWKLSSTDTNIDHRRVPNLMVYLKKHGRVLPITQNGKDYSPCDIITWDLGNGLTHIGLVSETLHSSGRPLIIHHIGGRPSKEDMIFRFKIIGHFSLALDEPSGAFKN